MGSKSTTREGVTATAVSKISLRSRRLKARPTAIPLSAVERSTSCAHCSSLPRFSFQSRRKRTPRQAGDGNGKPTAVTVGGELRRGWRRSGREDRRVIGAATLENVWVEIATREAPCGKDGDVVLVTVALAGVAVDGGGQWPAHRLRSRRAPSAARRAHCVRGRGQARVCLLRNASKWWQRAKGGGPNGKLSRGEQRY